MKLGIFSSVSLLATVFACLDVSGGPEWRFGTVIRPHTRYARITDVDPYAIEEIRFNLDSRLKENLKELTAEEPSSSLSFDEGFSIFSDMVDMVGNSLTFFTLADASFDWAEAKRLAALPDFAVADRLDALKREIADA